MTAEPCLRRDDVDGERALHQERERNAGSTAARQTQPGFDALRQGIVGLLDARERIAHVSRRGPILYDLRRHAAKPRGRRSRQPRPSAC